jgi:hypothetical protein
MTVEKGSEGSEEVAPVVAVVVAAAAEEEGRNEARLGVAEGGPSAARPGASEGAAGSGSSATEVGVACKVEIEPGLFRRVRLRSPTTSGRYAEFCERASAATGGVAKGCAVPVAYYADGDGDTVIVDCVEDFAGLLEAFEGCSEVHVRLFKEKEDSKKGVVSRKVSAAASGADPFLFLGFPIPEVAERDRVLPTELIKIVSENESVCLDVGSGCVREVDANVNTRTTRLYLYRLDGPSAGFVSTNHVVGIFDQDRSVRLDVSARAVKCECSARHNSWATNLHIRRIPRQGDAEFSDNEPLMYGELVGVFSSENTGKRLDIGCNSMKKAVPIAVDSWSTRLRIRKTNIGINTLLPFF